MRRKVRSTIVLAFVIAAFLLLTSLTVDQSEVVGVVGGRGGGYDALPAWLRRNAAAADDDSALAAASDSCRRRVCRKGICFDNMLCRPAIPPFLTNFKNPCFYEATSDQAGGQSIFTNLLTMYMLADKTSPTAKSIERMWALRRERPTQLRCLPYFFIIGMEKCGTTDLYTRLTRHPKIAGTITKEIQWWTRRRFVVKWDGQVPRNLQSDAMKFKFMSNLTHVPFDHYYSFFDRPSDRIEAEATERNGTVYHDVITADSSANTMYWHDYAEIYGDVGRAGPDQTVAQHVAAVLPRARLIASLRDPTDRLYSSYLFFNGDVSAAKFHGKVVAGLKRFDACVAERSVRACAYDRQLKDAVDSSVNLMQGLYVVFLRDWLQAFPREQLLVIHFESYKANELAELNHVLSFLEVEQLAASGEETQRVLGGNIAYQGTKYGKAGAMWNSTRQLLDDFYSKYNEELASMLGDERFLWRPKKS